MKKSKNPEFWKSPIGTTIDFVVTLVLVSIVIGSPIVGFAKLGILNEEWKTLLENYIPVGAMGVAFVIKMRKSDRISLETMLPGYGKNNIISIILGLALGLLCNLGLALLAMANGNISLSFRGMNIGYALIAFVIVAFQCIGEEIMDRVYLYQRFLRSKGPLFAIIGNAVLFSAMHISNLLTFHVQTEYAIFALLNIVLIGVFFAVTVYYFDNVWFAFAFHSAWNYCQNFILGLPNSGLPSVISFFATANEGTDSLIYSTKFGVEATLSSSVLMVVLIVVACVIGKRR